MPSQAKHQAHQPRLTDAENLFSAIYSRKSVRGFLPKPFNQEQLEQIFSAVCASPSNCNVQPWNIYVASGANKDAYSAKLVQAAKSGREANRDYDIADYKLVPEFRKRQVDCAVAMYGKMGIARDDRAGRMRAALRNYEFFDAPHVAVLTMNKIFKETVAVDMGIALQTMMLTVNALGGGSCPQGALRDFPEITKEHFSIPEDQRVLVGISFGYEDPKFTVNETDPGREILSNVVSFHE